MSALTTIPGLDYGHIPDIDYGEGDKVTVTLKDREGTLVQTSLSLRMLTIDERIKFNEGVSMAEDAASNKLLEEFAEEERQQLANINVLFNKTFQVLPSRQSTENTSKRSSSYQTDTEIPLLEAPSTPSNNYGKYIGIAFLVAGVVLAIWGLSN